MPHFQPSKAVLAQSLSKSPTCVFLRSFDYYAGVLDGEGCVSINRKGRRRDGSYRHNARISVSMCCLPILQSLMAAFGGSIRSNGRKSKAHYKTCWKWELNKKADLYRMLTSLAPYLIEKRQQVLTVLEYANRIEAHGFKSVDHEAYYLALRQQKRAA